MGFTGRATELERLLGRLAPEASGQAVLIFVVTGMGGIGKTALALEAAHRGREQGWFPGGTLFVDLRGYDDNPVTADQAVLALLDALGVQGPELPSTAARQYDVYRALLAERRERTLLILDNASDPAQFLDLLPGTDRHRVLITSRDRPDSLPVRLIDLEILDPEESVALVTRALHEADERDDRPEREPEALRALASLCGHLPLALQIAAAMLRRRRHRSVAALVDEISEAGDPATVLDNGSPGTDLYGRSLVLRPVLETSYRRLGSEHARLLRLLCLAPGADSGTEALAALADRDEAVVVRLLEELAAASLVSPVQSGERWRVHDLVRAFGARMVAEDSEAWEEGECARERVLGFYYRWTDQADDRLRWLPGMDEPERFTDRAQALAWLDAERAGLLEAVQWAGEDRFADEAMLLGLSLRTYLDWRMYFDDLIHCARVVQEAASRFGVAVSEAAAWNDLGVALRKTNRMEDAINALTCARDLYRTAGLPLGEAPVWGNLGDALHEAQRPEEAIDALVRARDMHEEAGDRRGVALAWNSLGVALQEAGRLEESIDAHRRSLELHHANGDSHSAGGAWNNLALALYKAERVGEALEAIGNAVRIWREFEDWYGLGVALGNSAQLQVHAGDVAEARARYLRSADAYNRAGALTDAADALRAADHLTVLLAPPSQETPPLP